MKLPIFIADAFTVTAFHGNPAAVCLLESTLDEDAHQHIAREMNLSETAFVRKLQPTDNFTQSSRFGLRWFTPEAEFPLCGHATLASAAVLFHKRKNVNSTLTFVTMSGELKARRAEDGIVLDFPLYPTFPQIIEDLIKMLIPNPSCLCPRSFLESLKVNTEPLPGIEKTGKVKGLILTVKGESGGQTTPYFAPWFGVPEDPVTGSTHTLLGPYWSEELGKKEMRAFQCSCRGGELDISLRPDGRVDMKGGAAVVLEGMLTA
uniref:Phenazine biosynthesis-like protein domain containing 2 n=1 Tax=Rattus norvegicus TaxID=10116 RepID=A0A8I5ZQ12_RAT